MAVTMVVPIPAEKKGFFGGSKGPTAPAGLDPTVLTDLASMTRRIRVMEEQYTNIRRRIVVLDQNMLSYGKKLKDEIAVVNTDFTDLKKLIQELDEKLILIIKELKRTAKKDEVEILKKYLDLWEPVNFVTHNEARKVVEDVLKEREEKKQDEKEGLEKQ